MMMKTYNVDVGELVQLLQQVDAATPDVTEQTAGGGTDAAGGQH